MFSYSQKTPKDKLSAEVDEYKWWIINAKTTLEAECREFPKMSKTCKILGETRPFGLFDSVSPSFPQNSSEYQKFVELSLLRLAQILSNLKITNINKIIYTSSASVYSLDDDLKNSKLDSYNRKLYASFKYSAEKLIENFCYSNNVNFYIMRLFNTYGDKNDQFSFIDKLIEASRSLPFTFHRAFDQSENHELGVVFSWVCYKKETQYLVSIALQDNVQRNILVCLLPTNEKQ